MARSTRSDSGKARPRRRRRRRDGHASAAPARDVTARLAEAERTRDRLAGLQRVTAELSAALRLEDVAVALHEEGLPALGADVVLILLRRGDDLELLFSHGVAREDVRELTRIPLLADLPVSVVARGRRPLFLAGAAEIDRAFPRLVRSHASWAQAAWAVAPLLVGRETIGVVALAWAARQLPFEAEERGFILALAGQCALAFERVRLADAERAARTEAQRAAEDAREVAVIQEHLMAVVGHDLRSPLQTIVMGAGRLLHAGSLADGDAATVARISAAARRASALISDLLDFARVRQGLGLRLAPAPADLGSICAAVVAEMRELHPGRALSVRCEGDVRGRWDPVRIAQLTQNLVTNALAHGGEGARVEVRVSGGDGVVRLTVWNDGPPVPEQELHSLFGPLRFAPGGQGGIALRSGLGLFIVREIAVAHGGKIEVRSSADAGTSFEVLLPRAAACAA